MKLNKANLIGISLGLLFLIGLFFFSQSGVKAFVVTSGSMQPAFGPGSLILTFPLKEYSPGDVITYRAAFKDKLVVTPQTLITHRILKKKQIEADYLYLTQGDANQTADQAWTKHSQVIGRAFVCLPLVGYVVLITQSQTGQILLILLPAIALVISQAWILFTSLTRNEAWENEV